MKYTWLDINLWRSPLVVLVSDTQFFALYKYYESQWHMPTMHKIPHQFETVKRPKVGIIYVSFFEPRNNEVWNDCQENNIYWVTFRHFKNVPLHRKHGMLRLMKGVFSCNSIPYLVCVIIQKRLSLELHWL